MNFIKSFPFCFSTPNMFPDEFEDKKTRPFFLGRMVTPHKETALS